MRDAILVAFHILGQDPDISVDDAKARATALGARITAAASVNAAQLLLSRQDDKPTAYIAPAATPSRPVRRVRAGEPSLDAGALIRATVPATCASCATMAKLNAAEQR